MHARKISRLIVNDSLGAFYLVETQVCILGGGVGGLWLQLELSNRGFHTIVVDHKHLGAFASTRNQGWLHSGAFYMVLGGTAAPGGVAKLCWQSSARLRQFCAQHCPDAILSDSRCIFAFDSEGGASRGLERISALGIDASPVKRQRLTIMEPHLSVEIFPYGVECNENPFQPLPILRSLITQSALAGGQFKITNTPLTRLNPDHARSKWHLKINDEILRANTLILAAGALNPLLLRKINGRELQAAAKRSWICVLHQPVTRNILVLQRFGQKNTTMFGPFRGGTTVNVEQQNVDVGKVGTRTSGRWFIRNFEWRLGAYMTGITENQLHFYTCDKLDNCDDDLNPYPARQHGDRHFFWTKEEQNLFSFYPGKFIAAPMAAEQLADVISERVDPWNSTERTNVPEDVKVAESELSRPPSHFLHRDRGNTLHIQEIR